MIGLVIFDSNANGSFQESSDIWAYTNRNGEFGRDAIGLPMAQGLGPVPTTPLYRMQLMGTDKISGQSYGLMTAPVGATVISPLTSLIDEVGSQAAVRQALGLDSGPSAISA